MLVKTRRLHGRCATRVSHHRDKSVSNIVATDGFDWTGRRAKSVVDYFDDSQHFVENFGLDDLSER